ncbi:hypothetical protein BKA56DRAFT_679234 [Ilyonectria sp. MPI-CAGE-AT-0026]|nr:hypothetical protein BKA56DRAFT_679234 [Ilyonectria sp. MPI-CAGE-AT-0026]
MDTSNIRYGPHSLPGADSSLIQLALDRDVNEEANLQQGCASIVPEHVNQRQDSVDNYLDYPTGDETTNTTLIHKNTGAFMMDPHKTSFEPTSEDLVSLYLNYEPSSNPPNRDTHRSCAGYGLPSTSGPKRRNSGGGDDQGRGKKSRSENHNDNTPSGGDGAGGDGNGGGNPEENDISNTPGNTPPPKHFACPFYKLDPEKHKKRCAHPVLTSWSRVFQHINRVHVPKLEHCPKCRLTFPGKNGENLKNAHCRLSSCQRADILQTGILLAEEYNKLKNIRAKSDVEKWIEGWHRLFPHLEAPWPFSETHLEFILRIAGPICLEFLQRAQGQEDLEPLATELTEALARTFTPALRVESSDAASTQDMQALGSGPASGSTTLDGSHVWPLNPSGQNPQALSGPMMPPSMISDTLQPNQQQPFAQAQQVPPDLSAQVQHHHSGVSAQEPFGSDEFQYGQYTQTQGLLVSDPPDAVPQQDFSIPQTPFHVREILQGIGANLPVPVLFPGDSYIQDEDGIFWEFPTALQPDSGN